MSAELNPMEPELEDASSAQFSQYLAHLHGHIRQIQQHTAGHDQTNPLPPSFYPPHSCWTSEEKGRFFHALAIHSRFRPDLVAEHVGTKTFADVCLYMEILQEALYNPDSISSSTGIKFIPLARRDFPTAHEVSDEWVEYEDNLATSVIASEPQLLHEAIDRGREDEIKDYRNNIRAKRGAARVEEDHRDRQGERVRNAQFQEWLQGRQSEWEVEDALRGLDCVDLRVLDTILREDEESWSVPTESTGGSKQEGSSHSSNKPRNKEHNTLTNVNEDADDVEADAEDGKLTESAVASLPVQEAPLSPTTRRRLQKRLYMRRKRAERTGKTADNRVTRLKPGRKAKRRKAEPEQDNIDGVNSDEEERGTRHAHASGKTLPYKIREELDSLGIDAVRLRQDGMGLFHMSTLAKLMSTYRSLHDVEEDVNSQISGSLIQTLHSHVVTFTSRLVRQSIVSREQELAIKTRTKVWRLATSPVIMSSNVAHALSLLSDKTHSRKDHFTDLLKRLDLQEDDTDASEHSNAHAADTLRDNISTTEDEETTPLVPSLPLNRATFPPFVRLPHELRSRNILVSLHSYIPWTASAPHDDENSLLPSETDEDELDEELADELMVDVHDCAQDEAYQRRLWLTFEPQSEDENIVVALPTGLKRKRTTEDANGNSEGRKKRKYRPRVNLETGEPQGKVKSAPFIVDSESE